MSSRHQKGVPETKEEAKEKEFRLVIGQRWTSTGETWAKAVSGFDLGN
jgi:hypothetical protein